MTQYSLAMAVLWGTVFLAAAAFLTKSKWFIQQFGTSGFLAIMLAGTVRLLLPLEFPQTPVLRDTAFTLFCCTCFAELYPLALVSAFPMGS